MIFFQFIVKIEGLFSYQVYDATHFPGLPELAISMHMRNVCHNSGTHEKWTIRVGVKCQMLVHCRHLLYAREMVRIQTPTITIYIHNIGYRHTNDINKYFIETTTLTIHITYRYTI